MNRLLSKLLSLFGCLLVFAFLSGCETTKVKSTWKAPDVGKIQFSKVLVLGLAPVDSIRLITEDAMKASITSVPVLTSKEILPNIEDHANREKMMAAIAASGVDGIIVLRLISNEQEVEEIAAETIPVYYQDFYGYYGRPYGMYGGYGMRGAYGMPGVYPGGAYMGAGAYGVPMGYPVATVTTEAQTIVKDHITVVETNIYSAKDSKLLWSALTKTTNAENIETEVPKIVELLRAKLREQKLIP